jgi:hypothetical protein
MLPLSSNQTGIVYFQCRIPDELCWAIIDPPQTVKDNNTLFRQKEIQKLRL